MNTKRRKRLIARCGFLVAATLLVAPILPWQTSPYVLAASPFVTLCSFVASRSFRPMMLIAMPLLVVCVHSRRWFCRYACPTGLILEQVGRVRSHRSARLARWPRFGLWITLLTLGGACAGYPLLLWTDPLAVFGNVIGLLWRDSWASAAIVAFVALLIGVMTLGWRRSWCGKVCPLGATQDLLAGVRLGWRRARGSDGGLSLDRTFGVPRRSVLAVAAGAVGAALGMRRADGAGTGPLRPPGAMSEARFIGLCVRCGNCVRACPEGLLSPDMGRYGIASLMTPLVDFKEKYCLKGCVACMDACPTGALVPFPKDQKVEALIGKAVIDRERCLLNVTECRRCISACPYDALRTRWDADAYEAVLTVDAALCPGCGACEVACPTAPEAIVVRPNRG